jgi:hypothetical protein
MALTSEKARPETLTWVMPDSEKSLRSRNGNPDLQPDVATIKQQATARAKAVHRSSNPRGCVPGQMRSLFGFGELLGEEREGVETTRPGEGRIVYFGDTNITS